MCALRFCIPQTEVPLLLPLFYLFFFLNASVMFYSSNASSLLVWWVFLVILYFLLHFEWFYRGFAQFFPFIFQKETSSCAHEQLWVVSVGQTRATQSWILGIVTEREIYPWLNYCSWRIQIRILVFCFQFETLINTLTIWRELGTRSLLRLLVGLIDWLFGFTMDWLIDWLINC